MFPTKKNKRINFNTLESNLSQNVNEVKKNFLCNLSLVSKKR